MQAKRSELSPRIASTYLKPLKLVEALNARLAETFRQGSPWEYYVPVGEPYFDGEVKIIDGQLKGPTSVFVSIQSTKWTPEMKPRLTLIRKLMHENLSAIRDVFICNSDVENEVEKEVHVIFESFPLSLDDIAGHINLSEARLTAILAQVSVLWFSFAID